MNKKKIIGYVFAVLAFFLSNIMSAVVAYNYRDVLCSIEHKGFSGPPSVSFLYAFPFLIGITICVFLAIKFLKNDMGKEKCITEKDKEE